jgi:membrane protein YqaA with SNARE-associated domain
MISYFSALVDFVHANSQYTHIAIFLLALSEAIPVVGTVVPGSTLIIGISALATAANANPWLLVIAAIAGAIIGDGLSFWLGQRYHREILNSWPLNKYPHLIARSERFVNQYGAASVCLALRARRTRVCAVGSWHPRHVAATVLCREYLVGTCVGTRSYFSWRAARDGAPIDHPKRRAAHNSRNRRVDCCDLHYFCHTLVL